MTKFIHVPQNIGYVTYISGPYKTAFTKGKKMTLNQAYHYFYLGEVGDGEGSNFPKEAPPPPAPQPVPGSQEGCEVVG